MAVTRQQIDELYQRVEELTERQEHQEALALAVQARDLVRQHLGAAHPAYAESLNRLADVHFASGDHAGTEPLLREALDIRLRALGEDHPESVQGMNDLAELYFTRNRFADAE